jgi:hypothetical protein
MTIQEIKPDLGFLIRDRILSAFSTEKRERMNFGSTLSLNIGVNNGDSSDAFARIGNRIVVCDVEGSGNQHNGNLGNDFALDRIHGLANSLKCAYIDIELIKNHLKVRANENGLVCGIEVDKENNLYIRTLLHRLEAINPDDPSDIVYYSSSDSDHTDSQRIIDTLLVPLRTHLQNIQIGKMTISPIETTQIIRPGTIGILAATDGLMKSMSHGMQHFNDPLDYFTQAEYLLGRELNKIWDAHSRNKNDFYKVGLREWFTKRKLMAESRPESIKDDLLLTITEIH